ncbi:MAG: hypothetical protein AAF726_22310 [Planctomycetota bacterium]
MSKRKGADARAKVFKHYDLKPWTPGADGYEKDGTPVSHNYRKAQDLYNRVSDENGGEFTYHVNPTGGIPHGEEHREMILEERRQRAQRREQRAEEVREMIREQLRRRRS